MTPGNLYNKMLPATAKKKKVTKPIPVTIACYTHYVHTCYSKA